MHLWHLAMAYADLGQPDDERCIDDATKSNGRKALDLKEAKALLDELMEQVMQKEKVRIAAQAAGVAAYDLVQKIFLLLIERGALSFAEAQVILCDSIETQQEIMDVEWAPVNEAAGLLLTRFSEAVERQH
jgi:hypothetical protein